MGSEAHQLHVFFLPFMAQGHMIPTVDIARLFALRGVKSTIISTPLNASFFSKTIDRDRQSGQDISVQIVRLPLAEAGLPEGCETIDAISSKELAAKFLMALNMLQPQIEKLLEEHRPDCIVADMFFPWVTDVAGKFGIPRLVFHGTSYFSMCLMESLKRYEPYEKVSSDTELFVVPGLPDKIEMTRSQIGDDLKTKGPFSDLSDQMRESELKSYGVLMNSFYELEPAYAEHYTEELGRRAWHIGPISLCNRNTIDKAHRGKKSTIDEHYCLSWLDSKKPKSVLYVSFGSVSRLSTAQLAEIAKGLEASGFPFIWVVRKTEEEEDKEWLPEGFEERMEGKGLIIKDWAPQVLILDHPAVGGFVTHCGWNSVLEGVSAGLPMVTWPMFAEQFFNEQLVTEVLKTGIRLGVKEWKSWSEVATHALIKCEKIEEVVTEFMGSGKEAEERRTRAKELAEKAKRAIEEGGSSYAGWNDLIEELRVYWKSST